jgi:hypothetical protein
VHFCPPETAGVLCALSAIAGLSGKKLKIPVAITATSEPFAVILRSIG